MSDNYFFIKRELRAFLEDDCEQSRELLPAYRLANSERSGRQGRYRKGPFALYYLFRMLRDGKTDMAQLKRELDTEFVPLVRRRIRPRAALDLERFLIKLRRDDEALHDQLFGAVPEIEKVITRYNKREIPQGWQALSDSLEQKRKQIKTLPLHEVEFTFTDMLEMGPRMRREIEACWREVRKDDRLTGAVYHFIRAQMKHKDDQIKLRQLQRRFTKTKDGLKTVLQRLSDHHLIIWDRKESKVQANSYNPSISRRFKWLETSSWPRSPFEPFLEKGKTYRVRDFREYVVEEWVKARAAEYV